MRSVPFHQLIARTVIVSRHRFEIHVQDFSIGGLRALTHKQALTRDEGCLSHGILAAEHAGERIRRSPRDIHEHKDTLKVVTAQIFAPLWYSALRGGIQDQYHKPWSTAAVWLHLNLVTISSRLLKSIRSRRNWQACVRIKEMR